MAVATEAGPPPQVEEAAPPADPPGADYHGYPGFGFGGYGYPGYGFGFGGYGYGKGPSPCRCTRWCRPQQPIKPWCCGNWDGC